MKRQKQPLRLIFFSFLLVCLLTGLTGISHAPQQAKAAPPMQAGLIPTNVVISEFRTTGPAGADDEFIEIFNPTRGIISIGGWQLKALTGSGTEATRATIPAGISLASGQYYLIANSSATGGYSGSLAANLTYTTGIIDGGGIALFNSANVKVDSVGLNTTYTVYTEGTPLNALSTATNQSYERKIAGEIRNCNDDNNNVVDFVLNTSSSNPQNLASPLQPCLVVTDVSSSVSDGLYTTLSTTIDITVTFSAPVYVSGNPTLQLETGTTDRFATYQPSATSPTNTLTFRYSTMDGDYTTDLDYISTTALSLNGGGIYDTIGNANLTLPTPGSAGSLGANKNIQIDIDTLNPSILSIKRQTPINNLTNADSLVFRTTFSEIVNGVDTSDFVIHSNTPSSTTTANITLVTPVVTSINGSVYDVTVSGGDLAGFNGVVGLDISGASDIRDRSGNRLPIGDPVAANDETYLLDNASPTVTINRASGQADPTGVTPINFAVVFSEPIVLSTFTASDISQPTNPGSITWSITNPSGDRRNFTLSATAITQANIVLQPSLPAGLVTDDVGNTNQASTGTNTTVTFSYVASVTIKQAAGQADPALALPIRFTVAFAQPIVINTFTPSDITSSGTATGITWTITNSGDNQNFTISATAVTVFPGTLIPSISANRVTDVGGNLNLASTNGGGDGQVYYGPPPTATPTLSRTPTPIRSRTPTPRRTSTRAPTLAPQPLVAISEFVPRPGHDWNNDGKINTDDEYIELLNHGVIDVNLSGYRLDDEANIGSSPYTLPSVTIKPGQRIVFYGSQTGLLLSDGGDGVRLLKANGQLMDAFNYTTVGYPDQAYCRLPDDGGADDWNDSCYPTPGLRNSHGSFGTVNSTPVPESLCPFTDLAPEDFIFAECDPFGNNIFRPSYWDDPGWLNGQDLINTNDKDELFAD